MSARVVLAVLGLVLSAQARVTVPVAGVPVAFPVLWLIAAAVVLAIAAAVLLLLRTIVRDWPGRMVTA